MCLGQGRCGAESTAARGPNGGENRHRKRLRLEESTALKGTLGGPRNPKKFEIAKELGATDCVNPKDHDKPIQQASIEKETG